jgi:sulfatase modifying factor 1
VEICCERGGQSKGYAYSGSNKANDVAWYKENTGTSYAYKLRAVGLKNPNELGLYDMSGNVQEWCDDEWKPDSSDPFYEETFYKGKLFRLTNGGSWAVDDPRYLWMTHGSIQEANDRLEYLGFRIIRY